jgi:hypothetical protein
VRPFWLKVGPPSVPARPVQNALAKNRARDLTGMRFGRWVVEGRPTSEFSVDRPGYWPCRCDCGVRRMVHRKVLRSGDSQSCGCNRGRSGREDLTGRRFGLLVVTGPEIPSLRDDRRVEWICQCDCGGTAYAFGSVLRGGYVKSCGCLRAAQGRVHLAKARAARAAKRLLLREAAA